MPIRVTEGRPGCGPLPRLLLTAALSLYCGSGQARERQPGADFGRFSERLVRCSVVAPGHHQSYRHCGRLRIEQNLGGLLSVRFSLAESSSRYGKRDLVFAGLLREGSEPMACRGDGQCEPRFPVELSIHAMASGLYSPLGIAAGLPLARVARGECRIEAVRASCDATLNDGERWSAEGFFLSSAPPDPGKGP